MIRKKVSERLGLIGSKDFKYQISNIKGFRARCYPVRGGSQQWCRFRVRPHVGLHRLPCPNWMCYDAPPLLNLTSCQIRSKNNNIISALPLLAFFSTYLQISLLLDQPHSSAYCCVLHPGYPVGKARCASNSGTSATTAQGILHGPGLQRSTSTLDG